MLPAFVAGPENRLVEAAVRSVLDDPLAGYNPIVLYGPSGTGKSHLAQGLAAEWKAHYRRRQVVYTAADDFARELADAIETQAVEELRAQYRKAALFVVEDIDRLAGKRAAQQELVHTFDILLAADRRIVVTAVVAPTQLSGIMPGLQSRLVSGLTVPLALPEPQTRLTILRRLAGLRKTELSEPVARLLAYGLSGTVPVLLGALVQLEMTARVDGGGIDAEMVRRHLAKGSRRRQPHLADIAGLTARLLSVRLSEMRGPSRRRAVVTARGVAIYAARQLTKHTLEQIGRYFGGRDRTTVMHSYRKTESLLNTDPALCRVVHQLQQEWQREEC